VGEGQALEVGGKQGLASGRAHGMQAGRKRHGLAALFEGQRVLGAEQGLDGPAQPGPEFDLAGDGAFSHFAGEARVEDEAFRKFDRLAHVRKVAFCYPGAIANFKKSEPELSSHPAYKSKAGARRETLRSSLGGKEFGLAGAWRRADWPVVKNRLPLALVAVAMILQAAPRLPAQDAAGSDHGWVPSTQIVPLFQPLPAYPFEMRASGIKGAVAVDFVVDVNGHVQNPVVYNSNNPHFEDAALAAVSKWKFKPATRNGQPVNAAARVTVAFALDDGGTDQYQIKREEGKGALPLIRTVRLPVYPYELRRDGVEGKAKGRVIVDPRGNVVQIEILESSRPEFGLALAAALDGMAFLPGVKDGVPQFSSIMDEQTFDDAHPEDPAAERLLRLERKHPELIYGAKALDTPLRAVSRRQPIFPFALRGRVAEGSADVLFLIDTDGHARLARVAAATDPAFGYAAVEAVSSWIFDVPTVHGKAVVARAVVPIRFLPSAPSASHGQPAGLTGPQTAR
jgi:TonB family protein